MKLHGSLKEEVHGIVNNTTPNRSKFKTIYRNQENVWEGGDPAKRRQTL